VVFVAAGQRARHFMWVRQGTFDFHPMVRDPQFCYVPIILAKHNQVTLLDAAVSIKDLSASINPRNLIPESILFPVIYYNV
jgi:hypothetical protein